ncbi:hypothetical protein F4814DRAFT_458018 [Daldinia grandis]|nr:hypothetical protein F4814DRAFT_458018 [Daldinia grandis]
MFRLVTFAFVFSRALAASEVPTSIEITQTRLLQCPFKVTAEISLESLDITYDTHTPTLAPSVANEHVCGVQFELNYQPGKNSIQVTEIDYDGDAEVEIGTMVAWSGTYGPVRFTTANVLVAETGPQRVTNTTPPMSSTCNEYNPKPSVAIQTRILGKRGGQIKQSLKFKWRGNCDAIPCLELWDISGKPSLGCKPQ